MERKHAILSASSAARWIACPPSARLAAEKPRESSAYADEGTCAHACAARAVKKEIGRKHAEEDAEAEALKQYHTQEMEECAEMWADMVLGAYIDAKNATRDAKLLIEEQVNYGHWAPGGFGTADAVIIADGAAHVFDFKYGKGVKVEAEKNPQMMCYALGVLDAYGFDYALESFTLHICQPRLKHYSEWEVSLDSLLEWANTALNPAAEQAWRGAGELSAGGHCRFCPVKGECAELARASRWKARAAALTLTPSMLAEAYADVAMVRAWCDAVEEQAMKLAQAEGLPGFKIVAGRSVRRITDPEAVAAAVLEAGGDPYKPLELRSLTELEKAVGKKKFAEACGAWVAKSDPKPALAPVDDPRPEWQQASRLAEVGD